MSQPPPPPIYYSSQDLEGPHGRYGTKTEATSSFVVFLNVVNTLTQLLLGAVAFSAFSFANLFVASSIPQHIYLCVIGYVLMMSQAILSMNTQAGWAYSLKYPQKKMIHWALQIVGSILAITGSIIKLLDADYTLRTSHAITGFVAMLLTVLTLIGGLMNFIMPGRTSSALYKSVHTCCGGLTITMAFVSLCLGFNGLHKLVFGNVNANLSIAFTVFALAGILISASSKFFKKID